MTGFVAFLLALLTLALCSLREPTTEARTLTQMRAAARHAGWLRCTGRALLLGIVPALYVLAAACWMCVHIARGTGVVVIALAERLDALTTRPRLEYT